MMIFKNGTTKDNLQFKDLCKEEHHVRIAYNNEYNYFEIDNITNTMVEYPKLNKNGLIHDYGQYSHEYSIMKSFFSKFNIKPTWINCNYTWGWFDNVTGHWTGAVGQVKILTYNRIIKVFLNKIETKKAELAIFGFGWNLGRIKVAHFLPAVTFQPQYWWTRYPRETTKMWNLIYLFTPTSWIWTFLSIVSIVITLKIFSMIGTRLGLNLLTEEITLFPFR